MCRWRKARSVTTPASLEFLEGKELPGVACLNGQKSEMRAGKIDGRIVLEIGEQTRASYLQLDKAVG